MRDLRTRWVFWAVLMVAVALAGFRFGIAPRRAALQSVERQIQTQEQLVAKLREDLRTFQPVPVEVPEGITLVPLPQMTPQLVTELVTMARDSGVKILALEMPSPSKPAAAEAPALSDLNVSLSLQGSFRAIARFVQGIEGSPWVLTVKNLRIRPSEDPSQLTAALTVTATLIQEGESVRGISFPPLPGNAVPALAPGTGRGPFEPLVKPPKPKVSIAQPPPLPPLPLPPPPPPPPAPSPPAKPAEPQPQPPAPAEVKLGITVVGIVVGATPVAIIRDSSGTHVVGVGEVVGEDIKVIRIAADRVTVQKDQTTHTLRVGESR
jgi:Tfp pilus assembly protein PilO